jgi:hypothetical protein
MERLGGMSNFGPDDPPHRLGPTEGFDFFLTPRKFPQKSSDCRRLFPQV